MVWSLDEYRSNILGSYVLTNVIELCIACLYYDSLWFDYVSYNIICFVFVKKQYRAAGNPQNKYTQFTRGSIEININF